MVRGASAARIAAVSDGREPRKERPMSLDGTDVFVQVAQVIPVTEAEGPGVRFGLWFQGCPLRCPGCCNPEMLPFDGGTRVSVADLVARVEEAARAHGVEGVTLL